jgi:hypothetical protein
VKVKGKWKRKEEVGGIRKRQVCKVETPTNILSEKEKSKFSAQERRKTYV